MTTVSLILSHNFGDQWGHYCFSDGGATTVLLRQSKKQKLLVPIHQINQETVSVLDWYTVNNS